MSRSQTVFQATWKVEFPWVEQDKRPFYALCTMCNKSFTFESMGRSALTSHTKSKKHKDLMDIARKTVPISNSVVTKPSEPSSQTSSSISLNNRLSQHLLDSHLTKDTVTEAEILWCIETVMTHTSLRSAESNVLLFKRMFPDSEIAKSLKLHKDKVSYGVAFGIAPYFQKELVNKLKNREFLVIGFDESLNKVAQKNQMDLNIRFWDVDKNQVSCRYLTSVFLHHTTAEDLLDGLKFGLSEIDLQKILQISMDGPHVNWKLIRLFNSELRLPPDSPKLLELGSCGLHGVNGAFKTGIKKTEWNLDAFLRASYNLFKQVPARRGDFVKITGCKEFPLKFCQVRWTENSKVARRIENILPHLIKYVDHAKSTKKEPTCNSFTIVADALTDKLLPAKLSFFRSLAEDLEPFLTEFQSDAPLAPFLFDSLTLMLKNCMTRFVKEDVILKTRLHKIDVLKKTDGKYENLKWTKDVDLGYATCYALQRCEGTSPKEILLFKQNCRNCLQHLVNKLLERTPLKYPLTEALTCLNPHKIAFCVKEAKKQLRIALDILLKANIFSSALIQNADREYKTLLSDQSIIEQMKLYCRNDSRLDDFWMQTLSIRPDIETKSLKEVLKTFFILSHGNATLERGFSVNKEMIIENLKEETLIAHRIIYDSVTSSGGLTNIIITKSLIHSMRNAHGKWQDALEKHRKDRLEEEKAKENQRKMEKDIKELNSKKAKLLSETALKVANIDETLKSLRKK
ncbi:uncharacterized protein LOC122503272 [Leptopilina heterotoma]|uniref:uncharacterized protein LOC122502801 n=1 Tax=Leptopilina heterotoma TaxID=63436 RepID=UPI001CA82CE3|nr:uncharacterized protein LOC122502801 [Leptopilina heterotoma]XP_043469681.1 uncharacterized protein LOC122503272 [Leptopilina heterotoma]